MPRQEAASIVARASAFNPPAVPAPAKTFPPHRRTWAFVPGASTADGSTSDTQKFARKSPYSVGTPSRENRWQVFYPFLAPCVGQTQTQSRGLDKATHKASQNPQDRVILGRFQRFLWDTGGTLPRKNCPQRDDKPMEKQALAGYSLSAQEREGTRVCLSPAST
jgi:hypothetical protein